MENNNNTKAIVSLVCGIVGIVALLIYRFFDSATLTAVMCVLALALGIVSIVFGVQARKEAPEGAKGLATAGMVCGIVATAWAGLSIVACIACVGCAACAIGNIAASMQ